MAAFWPSLPPSSSPNGLSEDEGGGPWVLAPDDREGMGGTRSGCQRMKSCREKCAAKNPEPSSKYHIASLGGCVWAAYFRTAGGKRRAAFQLSTEWC